MAKSETVTHTFPFFSALGILFIALKLTGHIDWPWLWVLWPLWLPLLVLLLVFGIVVLLIWLGK